MSIYNGFSTNRTTSGIKSFFESNSLVAKFAFLLLVIFIFVILLRLGIMMVTTLFIKNNSPHLIDGMIDAKQSLVITQDPAGKGSKTIYRSVNARDGIEFTWSVWIYVNDLQYLSGQYRHIFHKGNNKILENGMNFPNNAPGLYIAPETNALHLIMNTFSEINEEIIIPDIPINKWMNIIIRCENINLDVYINGTISRSLQLSGVPKQNYGDVFMALNGGFDGYISNLWYYDFALGTSAIQNLVQGGPNTSQVNNSNVDYKKSDYLSTKWYFAGSNNMYNS